jgi:murein DD-endopeptidase / murein LD-carboxypeptidase
VNGLRVGTLFGVLLSSFVMAAPYTVQAKETLYSISKKFNVPVAVLTKVNNLSGTDLKVGQILEIPERNYTVLKGDTLFGIAKRYGTTIQALTDLNKLGSSGIALGQVLLIPWDAAFFASSALKPVVSSNPKPVVSSASNPPVSSSPATPVSSAPNPPVSSAPNPPVSSAPNPPVSSAPNPPVSSAPNPPVSSAPKPPAVVPVVAAPAIPKPPTPQVNNLKPVVVNPSIPPTSLNILPVPVVSTPVPNSSWRAEPSTVLPQLPPPERPVSTFPTDVNSAKPKVWNLLKTAPLPILITPPSPESIEPELVEPSPVLSASSSEPILTYTIVSGDTLFNIAKRFGLTVELLRSSNTLTSDSLRIGQVLTIPQANVVENKSLKAISERYLGVNYVFGGSSASGLDCSGFTSLVFKEFGIALPRVSREQFAVGTSVERDQLREGDLVFFDTTGKGVSHVGIYLESDEFIHAASNPGRVLKSKLTEKYYAQRYLGARRVLADD